MPKQTIEKAISELQITNYILGYGDGKGLDHMSKKCQNLERRRSKALQTIELALIKSTNDSAG